MYAGHAVPALYLGTYQSLVPQAIHDTGVGLHLLQVLYANILQRNAYTLLPANKSRHFRVQRDLLGIVKSLLTPSQSNMTATAFRYWTFQTEAKPNLITTARSWTRQTQQSQSLLPVKLT